MDALGMGHFSQFFGVNFCQYFQNSNSVLALMWILFDSFFEEGRYLNFTPTYFFPF